jgi:hypothetical protein
MDVSVVSYFGSLTTVIVSLAPRFAGAHVPPRWLAAFVSSATGSVFGFKIAA